MDHTDIQRFVIDPPPRHTLKVADTEALFPVRRVYCVGRNYAAHAVEMGGDPDAAPPFFFQKNPDNLNQSGTFPYPSQSSDVHHEIELLVALGAGGRDLDLEAARACVYGAAVALDMTRRDRQAEAKQSGRPWAVAKAFEESAPCSHLVPATVTGPLESGAIWLDVSGQRRQTGDLEQMIWKIPEMISTLSGLFTLAPGDIILTGTPSGVGAVQPGDVLLGHIDGVGELEVRVT